MKFSSNELKSETDISSGFVRGLSKVFSLYGDREWPKMMTWEDDAKSLAGDWLRVGEDIKEAIEQYDVRN